MQLLKWGYLNLCDVKKAIPTMYKGILFRSKLEAQWAKFFDYLSIRWTYETEGYSFSNGIKYIPDFYFPEQDLFFEVKGIMDDYDEKKIKTLVEETEKPCLIGYPNGKLDLFIPECNLDFQHNFGGNIIYCKSDDTKGLHGYLSYDYNAGFDELSFLPDGFEIYPSNDLFFMLGNGYQHDFWTELWNKESRIEVV